MKLHMKVTALAVLASVATAALSPLVLADPASQQKNKNDWRNLATAGAAVAGYGLLKHNTTATVIGAAGAAYSAKRYEDERHSQSQAKAARDRARYHRSYYYQGRHYFRSNGHLYYIQNGTRHQVN